MIVHAYKMYILAQFLSTTNCVFNYACCFSSSLSVLSFSLETKQSEQMFTSSYFSNSPATFFFSNSLAHFRSSKFKTTFLIAVATAARNVF